MANICGRCAQPLSTGAPSCALCGAPAAESIEYGAVGTAQAPSPAFGGYAPPARAASFPPHGYGMTGPARYPKASLGARFLASVIDGLIQIACMVPGLVMLLVAVGVDARIDPLSGSQVLGVTGLLTLGVGVLGAVIYSFVKDGLKRGASLGKRAMGLMVVHTPTNRPCTMGRSAARAAVLLLLNFVPFVGWLIEPVMVLADDHGRRIGDRAADTQVVSVSDYVNTI